MNQPMQAVIGAVTFFGWFFAWTKFNVDPFVAFCRLVSIVAGLWLAYWFFVILGAAVASAWS